MTSYRREGGSLRKEHEAVVEYDEKIVLKENHKCFEKLDTFSHMQIMSLTCFYMYLFCLVECSKQKQLYHLHSLITYIHIYM